MRINPEELSEPTGESEAASTHNDGLDDRRVRRINSHQTHKGFTIIEVLMFLAITGLLLTGMLVGTGANLARERYNDGVRTVEEFLAQQFMLVQNPERDTDGTNNRACIARTNTGGNLAMDAINSSNLSSISHITTTDDPAVLGPLGITGNFRGRSDCLIYGRLIEFWVGTSSDDYADSGHLQRISATTIVGRDLEDYAIRNNDIDYHSALLSWNDQRLISEARIGRANDTITFVPEWGVSLAGYTRSGTDGIVSDPSQPQGAILIARMPISGSVRTFIITSGDTRSIDTLAICTSSSPPNDCIQANGTFLSLADSTANRYFCTIPDGSGIWTPTLKIIRVQQNVGNISAVSVLPTDTAADDEGTLIQCRQ
ncbi:prepilin-type N-terminal cleavage/methylation domain-containing protein [Candidatus Saccharibacteria bacterium]|nr:prepilin-type N-terminal cleavage/methylation domain-containing protein [Candidatus Saccharibacteria bacterium]